MRKFQIRNIDSDGCGSYYYVDVKDEEDAIEKCCEKANTVYEEYLDRIDSMRYMYFIAPKGPKETLPCVEYDQETKKAKRGGLKFQIQRGLFTIGYSDGTKSKYVTAYRFKK